MPLETRTEIGLDIVERDGIDDLADESGGEETSGRGLVDASLLHIEELRGVNLPGCGTVGALDIVGINLELWLGESPCGC